MAAYRHNPHEPPESSQSQPSIVRGSIPVELRDWQKGSGWGTLVMGPDGDIIRLSLWDPSGEHQLSLDDVTEEHAVRILVSEGEQEGQPWTILLEPESTAAEEDLSGKAEVTSGTRETSHVRMRRVARVGVHGDDINAEGRCGSGTDDGAPADGQIQSPERSPGVRGAVSGDQPVSTGGDAERKEGSERRREMDRAERKEDAPPGAGGDSEAPPQLTEDHRSHRRSPRAAHSAAETPLDTSIPQCPSGVRPEPVESHAKAAGISQTVRDVEREGRGRGEKGGKGGRKERKRGERTAGVAIFIPVPALGLQRYPCFTRSKFMAGKLTRSRPPLEPPAHVSAPADLTVCFDSHRQPCDQAQPIRGERSCE
ncbi:uncharacterized protein LOC116218643 [Clupea harengus]|uniref:Uncharacterized protein LOC116218643 n=1 Tax=Clupea harengus TaxID=7950 RepID=A0A6P8EXL3_CLUHA|nr:uncharacterized protein LOC116218643 [Clupea harengus]